MEKDNDELLSDILYIVLTCTLILIIVIVLVAML